MYSGPTVFGPRGSTGAPDGSPQQDQIARVHQAYGREYQLPNATAYNETCANIGNVLWNWRMLMITADAQYADVLELALYNSVLSGVSLDGLRFFYKNTLRQIDDLPFELRWPRTRAPYINCFCCPPNAVRTIAEVSSYAYSRAAGGVWVNLYGGSQLDTELVPGSRERLQLLQETDYPWDGEVTLRLLNAPADALTIQLRIPGWVDEATVTINGAPWPGHITPGTYLPLQRTWRAGDEIRLDLPLEVQLLEAHPLVEETRNEVAVKRGPLVYCLEANDLPGDVRPTDVMIPADIQLQPHRDERFGNLLEGAVILKGTALVAAYNGDWQGRLYRELQRPPYRSIDVELIPYFAWDNRGQAEMTVWMPLIRR